MSQISSSKPKTLVVGGTGRVGQMLARIWAGRSDVIFQSRNAGPGPVWDILNGPAPILKWMEAERPTVMIVLAGVTPGAGDMALNADLAKAALDAAKAGGVARVLYASSSAVYGPGQGAPMDEDTTPAPANPYGTAKLAAEAHCDGFRASGLEVCALRIGNVAGTDQLCRNAVKATADAPLKLDRFTDGHGPRRSYIAPSTLARVLETLSCTPNLPPVLNVAAPTPLGMEALLEAARAPWQWQPAPDGALQDVTLDCTRLTSLCPIAAADSTAECMVADWQKWSTRP